MPDDIFSFRTLFHALVRYEGANAYHEVLLQWLPQAQEEMGVLGGYGRWRREHGRRMRLTHAMVATRD